MLVAINPPAFVPLAIWPFIFTHAMHFIVHKAAFIHLPILVNILAPTFLYIISPSTLINTTIGPLHLALALNDPIFPFAHVRTAVLKPILVGSIREVLILDLFSC